MPTNTFARPTSCAPSEALAAARAPAKAELFEPAGGADHDGAAIDGAGDPRAGLLAHFSRWHQAEAAMLGVVHKSFRHDVRRELVE